MLRALLAGVLLLLVAGPPAERCPAADRPDAPLPRVLIIGDSISMGYTPFVKELLKDKAYVEHPKANCESTVVGLKKLDDWLGTGKWDVIHFNWGLHDLKYVKDDKGTIAPVSQGKQWVAVETYEKNLDELVTRLEKTRARLIWASTTPVPAGTGSRVQGDETKYNEAAARVMKAHHVPTDDLNAVAAAHPGLQLPKNVHFSAGGYKALAASVAKHVSDALQPAGQ